MDVHPGVVEHAAHPFEGPERPRHRVQVGGRVGDQFDVVARRGGRLPPVVAVHAHVGQADLRVLPEDLEGAAAEVGIEIEDADRGDVPERAQGSQREPVQGAETLAGAAAGMMQAAGEAARTSRPERLGHGIAHPARRGEQAAPQRGRARPGRKLPGPRGEDRPQVAVLVDGAELLAGRRRGRHEPDGQRGVGDDRRGDLGRFGDGLEPGREGVLLTIIDIY
ncbi:hypothetical protein EMGBS10_16290 [Opitutia bacterium]|nr:hypothetical protein EMGBS10_16290 [Opitutae bacterium]